MQALKKGQFFLDALIYKVVDLDSPSFLEDTSIKERPHSTCSRRRRMTLVRFKSGSYINNPEVLHLADKIYVVGHKSPDTDSVTSAITYANLKNALGMKEVVPAAAGDINNETKFLLDYFKVPAPEKLTDATDKKVILVDHNEMAQAVDKLNTDNIVEIVDHHKIGGIQTGKPIFFLNEPVGRDRRNNREPL